ncbi:MAG: VCBS repeat-containing protein [Planctomycetes bacterium]|nr:VCBS repeat-containing protein [Planctomycetota bacterium]
MTTLPACRPVRSPGRDAPRRTLKLAASALLGLGLLWLAVPCASGQIPFQHQVIDASASGDCKGIGDFDGDGLADVVQGGARLVLYRWPTWSQVEVDVAQVEFTTDMAVADVDGDGDPDLVVPDGPSGQNVLWYENPRPSVGAWAGSAWVRHPIGAQGDWAHDVVTADLDGDGRLDVVTRKGTTHLWYQLASGNWSHVGLAAASTEGEGTDVGDLDGDGDLDLAFNGYWVENTGAGWTKHSVASGWPAQVGVTLADLDADGRTDVLLAPAESSGKLAWYEALQPRTGPWTEHVVDGSVASIHTFKTGDMDLDGDLDIVTAEMFGDVVVYRNVGDASSFAALLVDTGGSHNLRVGDLGGDGDLDIVGANFIGNPPLEVWLNGTDPTGSSVSLGHALAGSLGLPTLDVAAFAAGGSIGFGVAKSQPNAQAVLVLGFDQIDVPFHGGVFVPDADALVMLQVSPQGTLQVALDLPPGLPLGFELFAQVWIFDPGGPFGLSATNGVVSAIS